MVDDAYLLLTLGEPAQHVVEHADAVVGRGIIDKDILDVVIALAEQGLGTMGDIAFHAIDGYEDRNRHVLRV